MLFRSTAADLASSGKGIIRKRRRNTLGALVILAAVPLGLALARASVAWLLVGLFFVSLIGLYVAVLLQIRQRHLQHLKVEHVADRMTEWDEPQVRVVAN